MTIKQSTIVNALTQINDQSIDPVTIIDASEMTDDQLRQLLSD